MQTQTDDFKRLKDICILVNIHMSKVVRGKRKLNKPSMPSKAFKKKVLSVIKEESEKKFIDALALNATLGFDAPIFAVLSNPAQGVGDAAQRVGSKITLNGLHHSVIPTPTGNAVYRWIIFQWHEDNGALAPALNLILQSTGTGADVIAPYNHDHARKFTIISDRVFNANLNTDNFQKPRAVTKNLSTQRFGFKKEVDFIGVGSTGTGLIYSLLISSNPVASADAVTYYGRVTYFDS